MKAMVSIKDGSIETDLYTKPTDKHQYLLTSCCHPHHTKPSIPYSLALRLCRICSSHDTYLQRTNKLTNYLANRSFDRNFLKTEIQQASDIPRSDALKKTMTRPFLLLSHATQHYLTSLASFTNIPTYFIHQTVAKTVSKRFLRWLTTIEKMLVTFLLEPN